MFSFRSQDSVNFQPSYQISTPDSRNFVSV